MKEIGRHSFIFNEKDNGGEALGLATIFKDNGDGVLVTEQALSLQSYCNCASFKLIGASLTPQNLRQLANELESKAASLGYNEFG